MITVYGTPICKDCLATKIIFEQRNVDYRFINITENTSNLRAFLQKREENPLFADCKKNGSIGIPLFIKGDESTFDLNESLSWEGIAAVAENEQNRITDECALLCK